MSPTADSHAVRLDNVESSLRRERAESPGEILSGSDFGAALVADRGSVVERLYSQRSRGQLQDYVAHGVRI
jgi:hypothetical protein